jgi:hypothetical protein
MFLLVLLDLTIADLRIDFVRYSYEGIASYSIIAGTTYRTGHLFAATPAF